MKELEKLAQCLPQVLERINEIKQAGDPGPMASAKVEDDLDATKTAGEDLIAKGYHQKMIHKIGRKHGRTRQRKGMNCECSCERVKFVKESYRHKRNITQC